jgi:hypothetical protein
MIKGLFKLAVLGGIAAIAYKKVPAVQEMVKKVKLP